MDDNINVLHDPHIGTVPVATKVVKGVHYPVYLSGFGDLTTDVWGTPKVSMDYSLFHGMFTFDVPPSMWFVHENDIEIANTLSTGAISTDGALALDTSAGSLDSVLVASRRHPRYQPDRGHKWSSALILPDKTNDGIRDFGLFEDGNGVFFRLNFDGNLYAVIRTAGVDTEYLITIPASFGDSFDVEKGNIYDIRFQWRGVGNYFFYIGNPLTGVSELVHTVNNLGTLIALSVENPALSAAFKATNITQDVVMKIGCVDVSSEGGSITREQYGEISTNKTGISTGSPVFAVRNPLLAPNGEINTRDLRLARITIGSDKRAVFKIYQTRDATAIVGGSWVAPKPGSFVERNQTIVSVDTAKMQEFSTFRVFAGGTIERENPSRETIDFFGIHGDYLVLVCESGASVDVDASIEFGEEI